MNTLGPSLGIKLCRCSPDSNLVFINQMAQRVTEDSPVDLAEFLKLFLKSRQLQNKRLTVVLKNFAASGGQTRQGNVPDFRRLHHVVFTGEKSHLDAEQWLIDMEKLLVAARVPEAD